MEVVRNGEDRTITLKLQANGAERILLVGSADSHIRSAGMPAYVRPIADDVSDARYTISCSGRSCDGAELQIALHSAKPVTFSLVGAHDGLPDPAAPLIRARPRFARPQYTPDETLTISHLSL
jgi:hypothetical protein